MLSLNQHIRNNDDNGNNDQYSKPPTIVAKLLRFKYKKDILYEAKSRKIRNIYVKEDFSGMKLSGYRKKRVNLL